VNGMSTTLLLIIIFLLIGGFIAAYMFISYTSAENPSRIPNGIYILRGDRFEPLQISGAYIPREPGYYFLYFHNNLCPHCQTFYPKWIDYLRKEGGVFRNITVIEVVCDWFTERCSSDPARSTFQLYRISQSPSFLLIKIGLNRSVDVVDIGAEYSKLKNEGKIPTEEFEPSYIDVIVRRYITPI